MIYRYAEKNKYGGYTWQIKIDSLFHVYLKGTKHGHFIVEFKEWKWVSYKILISYISDENIEDTIIKAFDKIYLYFQNNRNYIWTDQQKNNLLNRVLELLSIIEK